MGAGWKIGRVFGIELAIHPSWLVIAFLLTFSLADAFFPRFDPAAWTVVAREAHPADARHASDFECVDYVSAGLGAVAAG